jgi:flavin reductase ActVB
MRDPARFKEAMARLPGGVVIVTTLCEQGRPYGFTASSFSSVSMDPQLVVVSLAKSAECFPHFEVAGEFAVSLLREGHEDVAKAFATRGAPKFAGDGFRMAPNGIPVIADACASLLCETREVVTCGDHVLIVGEVGHVDLGDEGSALVYFRRRFWNVGREQQVLTD